MPTTLLYSINLVISPLIFFLLAKNKMAYQYVYLELSNFNISMESFPLFWLKSQRNLLVKNKCRH
jgi:hypothetical protein